MQYIKIPLSMANKTIKLPYFMSISLVFELFPVFMLRITASKAFLTNSAGYKANKLAMIIKTVPIASNVRYFQKNLLR